MCRSAGLENALFPRFASYERTAARKFALAYDVIRPGVNTDLVLFLEESRIRWWVAWVRLGRVLCQL
jgi:hypothetical protein